MSLATFAAELGRHTKAILDPIVARVKALEDTVRQLELRCAEAEQKAAAAAERYKGIFQRAQADEYRAGAWVTHRGSMWVALRDAPGTPGEGYGWQLAVQRGADAR